MKETEFKNHKTKVKQLQSEIETLKREYDEAKEGLNEIKVNSFCFCYLTLLWSNGDRLVTKKNTEKLIKGLVL